MIENHRFFLPRTRPIVLGHRGVPRLHQENSLGGLRRAVELGIDGVEFDVFLTRDGRAVVFHDEETERLTGVKGNITQMTWDEVSRLRLQRRIAMDAQGAQVLEYPCEERVPLLEEVLDEFSGKLLMNIEMKAYAPKWERRHTGTEVAKLVRKAGAEASVIITSFDFFMLHALEQEYPALHSGFAYDDFADLTRIDDWFDRVDAIRADRGHIEGRNNPYFSFINFLMEANTVGRAVGSTVVDAEASLIDEDTTKRFHQRGMLVGAYTLFATDTRTVRDPTQDQAALARRLRACGIDWIETDDPERLTALLEQG